MRAPSPTRRGFIAGAVALAAGAGLTGAAAAAPAPRTDPYPFLGPHRPEEAAEGLCHCRACMNECIERGAHPLRQAVAVACHKARSAAWVLWYSHAQHCHVNGCGVCESADFATWHLDSYASTVGCELTEGPDVTRAMAECRRVQEAARRGRFPKMPPAHMTNHPAQEPLALALLGFAEALRALMDGHGCGDGDCFPCEDAHGIVLGVQHIFDTTTSFMVPTEAVMRREARCPVG
jgi:hypothetical protein